MKLNAELLITGLDIARSVFQLHIVDPEAGEVERKKRKRDRVAPFFANRPPSVVALEACGDAQYWARTLAAQGHQVKLLPEGHRTLMQRIEAQLAAAADRLPSVLMQSIQEQCDSIHSLQDDIGQLDRRLLAVGKENVQMQALQSIPGIIQGAASALGASLRHDD